MTNLELAMKFAPVLHLHPEEGYKPMDPNTFIGESRLILLKKNKDVAVLDLEKGRWDENLSAGKYGLPVNLLEKWTNLHDKDNTSWSRRPYHKKPPKDEFQYALDNKSDEPRGQFDPNSPPPCFYFVRDWKNSKLVSYWCFYGFSKFAGNVAHQGDWEHVTLRIRDDSIISGFFAVHDDKYYVKEDELEFDGDGRIQVYSAKSRHATWWKPGSHDVLFTWLKGKKEFAKIRGFEELLLQDEMERGTAWNLGSNLLALEEQPWREFGGAWGRAGDAGHSTGPLGPWFKRIMKDNQKVIIE